MRPLVRRIGRIEAAKRAGTVRPIPRTIFVRAGETKADAIARFNVDHPNRPRNHQTLIVPAKPRTDAEREVWAERFKASQLALVAAARSERTNAVKADQSAPHGTPKVWPNSPTIRPNGPHITWKRNTHD
ncbi:MAG: hypothetical protein ABI810_15830 [Sphingomonas bacterium]